MPDNTVHDMDGMVVFLEGGVQRIPSRKVAAERWRSGESEERTARYDKSAVRPTKGVTVHQDRGWDAGGLFF